MGSACYWEGEVRWGVDVPIPAGTVLVHTRAYMLHTLPLVISAILYAVYAFHRV